MRRSLLALVLVVPAICALGAPAGAQPGGPAPTPGAPSPTVTIPDETTTTAVIDNRELGRIIQRPNAGKAPESPGDPGGWLQVSLFFLICAIVVLMVLGVAWRSKRLRQRREAAGQDPVSLARARGEGTRRPPTGPPTPVD